MSRERQTQCECTDESAACVALESAPIDEVESASLASGYKALGDPHRVKIVHLLAAAVGPVCVVDIEQHVPLSQSTVSYHLRILVDAGVLALDRRGRWSYYTVRTGRLAELTAALDRYRALVSATTS